MSDEDDAVEARGQLRQEAATWFARMRGPDADHHRLAFEAWLARGALHRSAYSRIAEIFSAGKLLKNDRKDLRTRLAFALLPVVLLSVAAIMLALELFGNARGRPPTPVAVRAGPVQIASVVGELRKVALADGSVVTLDTDSLVSARLNRASRVLRLERGRARFQVHHDGRTFVVLAGDHEIVARGTIFDVSLLGRGQVEVTLLRGVVDVSKLRNTTGRPREDTTTLIPGQRVVASGSPRPLAAVPIGHEADWTRQRLVFDRTPLSVVVETANRYGVDKIRITDPATARLRVSGSFRAVDTARIAERLAALFDLVVERPTPGIIVLRPRPQS